MPGALHELELKQEFFDSADFNSRVEYINTKPPRGLVEVNQLANDLFAASPYFDSFRTILGDSPSAQARVIRTVAAHDFPSPAEVGEETYTNLLKITHLKEEISRRTIIRLVKEGATFGLQPHELDVLITSCEIGCVFDRLCFRWRDGVTKNPANVKAKELGMTNQYSVIKGDGLNGYMQVPYADAFPEEVNLIVDAWRELAQKLTAQNNQEASGLATYFTTFADALRSHNLDTVADAWKDVDRVWMRVVKGRMQPIGSREYAYYDPNKIRVFPDFRLAMSREIVGEGIAETKSAVEAYIGREFGHYRTFQGTLNALRNVQIFLADDIVFAGSLDFQAAGQSLPNEEEVQRSDGTKTFLNQEAVDQRWQLALALADRAFPQDTHLFRKVNSVADNTEKLVAGHEFAEPLFHTKEVEESLGHEIISLLNEDLANLCATMTLQERVKEGKLPQEVLTKHAVLLLGIYLRYLDVAREQEHLQPYYIGIGLQGLRRMVESDFIVKREGTWRIDESKLDTLLELSRIDLYTHARIAESGDKSLAQIYLSRAAETPDVLDLLKILKS